MSYSPQPRPSLSSTLLGRKANQRHGIKLAPTIASARIISTLRRHDQKIWYSISVVPRNDLPNRKIVRAPYTVFRRYEDFLAFSNRLQEIVGPSPSDSSRIPKSPRAHKYKALATTFIKDNASAVVALPRLKSRIVSFVTKQDSSQRREDLDNFLDSLFRLPDHLLKSLPVLEFFGIDKSDMEHKVSHDMNLLSPDNSYLDLDLAPQSYSRRLGSVPSKSYSIIPPPMLSRSCSALAVKVPTSAVKKAISNPNFNQDAYVQYKPNEKNVSVSSKLYNKAERAQKRLLSAPSPHTTLHVPPSVYMASDPWDDQASNSIRFASKDEVFNRTDLIVPNAYAEESVSPLEVAKSPLSVAPNPKLSLSAPAPRKKYSHLQRNTPFPKGKEESTTKNVQTEPRDSASFVPLQRCLSTPILNCYAQPAQARNIRIKVIYDLDNIIILQVPRNISLRDLETRIESKLSNIHLPANAKDSMSLLFYGKQRTSHEDSQSLRPSDAYRIASIKELAHAMMTMWSDLDKVTVRLTIGMLTDG
jgi:PX domain